MTRVFERFSACLLLTASALATAGCDSGAGRPFDATMAEDFADPGLSDSGVDATADHSPDLPDAIDLTDTEPAGDGPYDETPDGDSSSAVGDPCAADGDCSGLVCDPASLTCVICVESGDCPEGTFCRDADCIDWICVPGSRTCEGTVLVTCSQEGDGPIGHIDCDDGDDCTEGDACKPAGCVAGTPIDCDDANQCTADSCEPGTGCTHSFLPTQCDDNDPCTEGDTCSWGECVGGEPPDCDDGNPCTDDKCDPVVGCRHDPNDSECDDSDACTTAQKCSKGLCAATDILDCTDQDPCTEDSCDPLSGTCFNAPIPGCHPCKLDSECDDGNPCSVDNCDGGSCKYYPGFLPQCCFTESDCGDGDPCTSDSCPGAPYGACVYLPVAGEGCCDQTVFQADFEGGDTHGISFDQSQSGVGWFVIQTPKASSQPWAMYYGNPDASNYDSGQANEGSALTPEIPMPAGVELKLSFETWMDVEKAFNLDFLSVEASTATATYPVWRKPVDVAMKTQQTITADLSALQARNVRIRFTFDTTDGEVNDKEGVYVDDVGISGPCVPKKCGTDIDCWSLGMGGVCAGGSCDFTEVLGQRTAFGTGGTGPGQLDGPYDLALAPGGDLVFVSDKAHHRVQTFDTEGGFNGIIGSYGAGEGQFNQPHGLAATTDRLYVADTKNHRVEVFTHAGVFMFAFGSNGDGDGLFNQPKDVALTADSAVVYVADTSNHRIQAFDKDGGFLLAFGSYGKAVGQMRSPSCVLALPGFRVLVCDTQNHRVQVFEFDGTFVEAFKPSGDLALYYPYGAALGPSGRLLVADTYHHRIEVVDQEWQVVNSFGSAGTGAGQFSYPMGMDFGPSGNLYVADSQNNRVVVFGYAPVPL